MRISMDAAMCGVVAKLLMLKFDEIAELEINISDGFAATYNIVGEQISEIQINQPVQIGAKI